MNKIVLIFIFLANSIIESCPNCLGYAGPRFRKRPLEFVRNCNCPCNNYIKSNHVDGYKCLQCGHRLIPRDINKPEVEIVGFKEIEKLNKHKKEHNETTDILLIS